MTNSKYPLEMYHPNFAPAQSMRMERVEGRNYEVPVGKAVPAKFPPIVVRNSNEEEYSRAIGYLAKGEARKISTRSLYPIVLSKKYPEAKVKNKQGEDYFLSLGYTYKIPRKYTLKKPWLGGKDLIEVAIGEQAKNLLLKHGFTVIEDEMEYQEYPLTMIKEDLHKVANDEDEEKELLKLGYSRPGKADEDAYEKHSIGVDIDYVPQEDPEPTSNFKEYPKYIGTKLVHSEKEEQAYLKSLEVPKIQEVQEKEETNSQTRKRA